MFIGLIFWKKEKDPRIKPFWKNIGKKNHYETRNELLI
jgi:hypothetical protein